MSPYENAEALKVTAHWTFYQVHLKSTFAFRAASILHCTVSIRSWKHFSKILLRIDNVVSNSCFGFVGCTSLMWISRSATFQGCSAGWRSGDSGGYLSTMNSLTSSVIRLTRLHYLEACILWTYTLPSFFIFHFYIAASSSVDKWKSSFKPIGDEDEDSQDKSSTEKWVVSPVASVKAGPHLRLHIFM